MHADPAHCGMQAGKAGPREEAAAPAAGSILGFLQPALVRRMEPLAALLRGATTLGSARLAASAYVVAAERFEPSAADAEALATCTGLYSLV